MIISVNSKTTLFCSRYDSVYLQDKNNSILLPKELQGKIPSLQDFTLSILPGRIEIRKGNLPNSSEPYETVRLNTIAPLNLSVFMIKGCIQSPVGNKFVIEDSTLKLVSPFGFTFLSDLSQWVESKPKTLSGVYELLEPCLNIIGQEYGKIDVILFTNIWNICQINLRSGNRWITLPLTRWLSDMDEVAYLSFLLNGEIYRLLEDCYDTN